MPVRAQAIFNAFALICFATSVQGLRVLQLQGIPETRNNFPSAFDLSQFFYTHTLCRVVLQRRWMSPARTFSEDVENPLVTACSYLICNILHRDAQRCEGLYPGVIQIKMRSRLRRQEKHC